MVIRDDGESFIEKIVDVDKYFSIGIGPGIDQKEQTELLLASLINNYPAPKSQINAGPKSAKLITPFVNIAIS